MADAVGRRDPIGERVISVMSRQDAAEHMRGLLRSLTPSDAQVIAARYMGIPGAVLAGKRREGDLLICIYDAGPPE